MTALPALRPPRATSVVRLTSSEVDCEVRLLAVDAAERTARYEVELRNTGPSPAGCRIIGVTRDAPGRDLGSVAVASGGCGYATVAVPMGRRWGWTRLDVQVVGTGTDLIAAVPIPHRVRRGAGARAAAALAVGSLAIGAATVASFAIERAPAPPATSTAPVTAPATTLPRSKSAKATPVIAPRIASFAARRDTYAGRSSVLASYLASGDRGTVRVIDEHGRIVARAPFSRAGATRLAVTTPAGEVLDVQLEVWRGTQRTTSWVELPPLNVASAVPPRAHIPSADAVVAASATQTAVDPVAVTQPVVAGRPFVVAVRRAAPNLRVALQSALGETIEEVAVPSGSAGITLHAPPSDRAAKYFLVATYGHGAAGDVMVRSLRIAPG